jgi:hypothetical protein
MPGILPNPLLYSVAIFSFLAAVKADDASSPPATPSCDRFHKTGFWAIDIDNYPALPPECGPPIALHADRNTAHLPVQIVSILASYVVCTLAVGISILAVRKKRKQSLGPKSVELKLVLKDDKRFEPSIGSPASSLYSWMRNPLRRKHPGSSDAGSPPARSPGIDSVASFDQKVLDHDRLSRQQEMDRLYAAVMAHDEARRSETSQVSQHLPRASVASTVASRIPDKRLARLTNIDTPRSPVSPIRAIYPPDHELPGGMALPLSPTSPIRATLPELPAPRKLSAPVSAPLSPVSPTTPRVELPDDMYPASPPPGTRRMRFPNQPNTAPLSPPLMFSPSAILSPGIHGPTSPIPPTSLPNDMYPASPTTMEMPPLDKAPSTSSKGSKDSKGSKGRKMLRNMRINTSTHLDDDAELRAPLSATFREEQLQQEREPPTPPTAGTRNSNELLNEANEADRIHASPPRRPPALRIPTNPSQTPLEFPPPPQQPLPQPPKSARSGMSSQTSGSKPLPLRVAFPDEEIKSPIMRTTVLQPRKDNIGRGPRTARTPRTGVPQTPYTPYMPFTPVTPVTPHLVTRQERRQQKKMEGKTLLDESDLVKEEDEDWE